MPAKQKNKNFQSKLIYFLQSLRHHGCKSKLRTKHVPHFPTNTLQICAKPQVTPCYLITTHKLLRTRI